MLGVTLGEYFISRVVTDGEFKSRSYLPDRLTSDLHNSDFDGSLSLEAHTEIEVGNPATSESATALSWLWESAVSEMHGYIKNK